jgi:hypothetical protein
MNFDRLSAVLVRVGAAIRRILPWPYAYLSALRAAWAPKGYFKSVGLLTSMARGRPVDADGSPLPLLSYPVIHLLESRLHPDLRVFEYGSGGSTTFFADRVRSVISVEHDLQWIDELTPGLQPNVTMLHRPVDENGRYAGAIDVGGPFDVVLIDGRDRLNCLRHAIEAVSATGVIIVDDTERPPYAAALTEAVAAGFRQLDLVGLRPGGVRNSITTVLYRPGNCLGI